jgi:nucleoside-diphosphate-sugar epimerase
MKNKKKIIIIGANGFIGDNFCKKYKDRFNILKIGRQYGNLAIEKNWQHLPKAEVMIQLANFNSIEKSFSSPNQVIKNNIDLLLNALAYCRKYNCKMIYLSSYVYGGNPIIPTPEFQTTDGNNPYSLSKIISEQLICLYRDYYSVNSVILRPFNVYGYGQSKRFLISNIINCILKKKEIEISDFNISRDYIYIDDILTAIFKSVYVKKKKLVLNIGSGKSFKIVEVIKIIEGFVKKKLIIKKTKKIRNPVQKTKARISSAKTYLNWEPKFSLKNGIKKIIEYEKKNHSFR